MVDDDVDDPNGAFNLSPVQQMFLGQPKLPTQFHSSIYPRILEDVEISLVTSAIEGIVRRHSMLRARFTWGENGWQQNIVKDVPNPYSFEVHDIEDETRIREVVAAMHGLLDIVDGPVFATDIFNTNSGAKRLILVAHHLVVNLVYWQTILWPWSTAALQTAPESKPFPVFVMVWATGATMSEAKAAWSPPSRHPTSRPGLLGTIPSRCTRRAFRARYPTNRHSYASLHQRRTRQACRRLRRRCRLLIQSNLHRSDSAKFPLRKRGAVKHGTKTSTYQER